MAEVPRPDLVLFNGDQILKDKFLKRSEATRPDLALFGGDEILKHKFLKRCVANSDTSDSSNMEEGWEGGSGDDSFLYQATDMVEDNNSDSDMFSDNEKKVIPDTPSDEEVKDDAGNDDDLDKETGVLRGLLEELGLKFNSAVTKSCRTTKGMVICDMTCKVDKETSFNAKLARPDRAAAMLTATRDITAKLRRKFFPEKLLSDQQLCGHKQSLMELCKAAKRPEPHFTSWLERGLYCARVEVGEEAATAGAAYQVLAEAEGSAAQLWIDLYGGVREAKTVPFSEAFAIDVDDTVDEQVSKENLPSMETDLCKEMSPESNRRPKQGGFFSSLDNITTEELSVASTGSGTPDIKTAFALLDKKKNAKEVKHWSPRKEAAIVPRRSPRKQMKLQFQTQKKSDLMKELFDDSSLSVASQDDNEEEEGEPETPVKRARSVSSEKSAKKSKQEKDIMTSSVCQEVTRTHRKKDEKSFSPTKSDDKYLGSKKSGGSEIPATPPAPKVSPKKKFGMFGKLSKKVEEEVEVKPKFQFHQPKEEQKSIKDHFSFGKDKKSIPDKGGESKKVEDKSQSKKSKVFGGDVDPDFKDLYGGKPDKGSLSKKSKDNGSLKKKSEKSKIFEEEFDNNEADFAKKSEKKVKTDKKENKKSIGKVTKKSIEKESPVKKPSFKFLEEDKICAQKSKSNKLSGKSKAKDEDIEPVVKTKESISSVFEVEDDPYVLEIQARKKKEAEKLAARTKVKTKGRKRDSMARMAEFSQSLTGSQSLDECSQESSSDESAAKFKIPKLKKPRKKKESDPKQKKINSFFKQDVDTSKEKESNDELEEARDYTPSIDELLKLPDRPEDGGKTMDEVLDDLDIEIAERKKKHEEEMAKIDTDIAAEKQRQEERRERMKKNALLRNRLEVEITESVLRRMFEENTEYLRDIEAGRVESSRHQAFHKSSRTRHALYYTMITDPFTDDQLEWTLEEMGKVWMKNKREQMDNNEYVWKVLLAECFIKFYMDHFGFDKKEAEKRISETPLRKAVEDSEEENSSDDDM